MSILRNTHVAVSNLGVKGTPEENRLVRVFFQSLFAYMDASLQKRLEFLEINK